MAEIMFRMLQANEGESPSASPNHRARHRGLDADEFSGPVACMEDEPEVMDLGAPGLWSGVDPSFLPANGTQPRQIDSNNSQDNIFSEGMKFSTPSVGQENYKSYETLPGKSSVRSFSSTVAKSPVVQGLNTPAMNTWAEDKDPHGISGLRLSEYMGAREISTPVQRFHEELITTTGDTEATQILTIDHANTSPPQATPSVSSISVQEDEPLLNGPLSHRKKKPDDFQRSKESLSSNNPVARKRFQKAVRNVVTTNAFMGVTNQRQRLVSLAQHDFLQDASTAHRFKRYISLAVESLSFLRVAQRVDQAIPLVNPNSRKRRYWDFMILIFVIYNAVAVPLDAGFPTYKKADWLSYGEVAIDVIFFLDIIYNFRTAYVDDQGNMIRDSKKIAGNYLKSWFSIDVLASIPFEWVALGLGINVSEQVTLLAFLKTPRLLRLGRLLRFFERMKNANVFRIVRLMATMCLIAHWIACIWHFLYVQAMHLPWLFTDLEPENVVPGSNPPSAFLVAFYSSFVLMMGDNVNPQNNIEYIFCCAVLVVGACFMATVVGNMALLVSNMNVTAARHRTKMDMITDATRYLGMPDQIQERVQEYFDYLATFSHPGPEGMRVLGELPTSLYEDICALLHVRVIRKVPPFKDCEEPFIMQLVTRLSPAVYMPGETIFRGGDVGHEMYLISKGQVCPAV
mmetsp:Transcript_24891/g.69399  ORF Transcript_24891/g.69399 Transcript_24891/m.69399 type:complete len:684 (+) Transcript_24891:286-2337(+)